MRIQIAARRDLRTKATRAAARLKRAGHQVVSRWIDGKGRRVATADDAIHTLADIAVADCAQRAGNRLCMVGPRETTFCHLGEVESYSTIQELIYGLR